jgi:predicted Ser/Thr protein kinase
VYQVPSVPDYEIPISELEFKRPIGKGAFGEIYVAKWRGTTVAAKTILAPLANNPQIV